ncbi:conjugal transfer protein TraV [Burkholderia cepacia]|uniref:TraV family lipoprotein n=1 Tax=Burkholderia cepacia TaxID=292 RepID=UPI00075B67B2|nr:TraV family lipoprotein [Burkholderia cepacia]KVV25066.1 conjugal transfer protein TraV [Burkholderia cepacia]
MKLMIVGVVVAGALSACSFTGLDAQSHFSCKAPEGVLCESMSGIYANTQANNLPGQRVNRRTPAEAPAELSQAKAGVMTKPIYSGTPIRSAPRVLRAWFAPWEDTDGDLHDQSYVYLPIDSGHWLIEHNRRRIQDSYRPVRAAGGTTSGAPIDSATGTAPTQSTGGDRSSQPANEAGSIQGGAGEEVIGVRQDRVSAEQASQFLSGVLKPSNVTPGNE